MQEIWAKPGLINKIYCLKLHLNAQEYKHLLLPGTRAKLNFFMDFQMCISVSLECLEEENSCVMYIQNTRLCCSIWRSNHTGLNGTRAGIVWVTADKVLHWHPGGISKQCWSGRRCSQFLQIHTNFKNCPVMPSLPTLQWQSSSWEDRTPLFKQFVGSVSGELAMNVPTAVIWL